MVWRKLCSSGLTREMVNDSLRTASCTVLVILSVRESSVARNCSDRPSTSKEITLSSLTTILLVFRLWGATGVITNEDAWGNTTGPPQLSEYPVEPVGVATIS